MHESIKRACYIIIISHMGHIITMILIWQLASCQYSEVGQNIHKYPTRNMHIYLLWTSGMQGMLKKGTLQPFFFSSLALRLLKLSYILYFNLSLLFFSLTFFAFLYFCFLYISLDTFLHNRVRMIPGWDTTSSTIFFLIGLVRDPISSSTGISRADARPSHISSTGGHMVITCLVDWPQ